jgi:hypothetical protein
MTIARNPQPAVAAEVRNVAEEEALMPKHRLETVLRVPLISAAGLVRSAFAFRRTR